MQRTREGWLRHVSRLFPGGHGGQVPRWTEESDPDARTPT